VSFRPNKENVDNLRRFFERAKRGKFLMGWEPRGAWDPELIAKLCGELDLVHVVNPLQMLPAARAPLRYFRLHGQARLTDTELRQLQGICTAERISSYCLFNNAAMAVDAEKFARMLGGT